MPDGFSITTYRFQINYSHIEWFKKTQEFFNKVLIFYYDLLLQQNLNQQELSNQHLMRELEKLTIKSRDGKAPIYPLPYNKIPLYFRRAAISAAIAQYKSFQALVKIWKQNPKGKQPQAPESPKANMVYYKGMYKDFDRKNKTILLKLFTGNSWKWLKFGITGREIPEDAEVMSPTIVIRNKYINLNVPIKTKVSDIRTAKERVADKESFVTVKFAASDTLAVCLTTEADGKSHSPLFIKGGKALMHRRNALRGKAKKTGSQKYYEKINRLNEDTAQNVSRQIVDYAVKQQSKIILIDEYTFDFGENGNPGKAYLYKGVTDYIGRRISSHVKYKAWQSGIVVTRGNYSRAPTICHKCGAKVKKYSNTDKGRDLAFIGGTNFKCENGHQGNAALNTVRNVALDFYNAFYR